MPESIGWSHSRPGDFFSLVSREAWTEGTVVDLIADWLSEEDEWGGRAELMEYLEMRASESKDV